MKMDPQQENILFFDGKCNLCNSFVDFLVRRNRDSKLKIASLQGKTALRLLPRYHVQNLNSVVLYKKGVILDQSNAALEAIMLLSPKWKFLWLFYIFPKFVRNFIYQLIAKNRYKLFGRKQTCRLPTQKEKAYLLD